MILGTIHLKLCGKNWKFCKGAANEKPPQSLNRRAHHRTVPRNHRLCDLDGSNRFHHWSALMAKIFEFQIKIGANGKHYAVFQNNYEAELAESYFTGCQHSCFGGY